MKTSEKQSFLFLPKVTGDPLPLDSLWQPFVSAVAHEKIPKKQAQR